MPRDGRTLLNSIFVSLIFDLWYVRTLNVVEQFVNRKKLQLYTESYSRHSTRKMWI